MTTYYAMKCDYCPQPGIELTGDTNGVIVCIDHASKVTDDDATALARIIWTTSRADESTISATGADIVARAILNSDWLADYTSRRL